MSEPSCKCDVCVAIAQAERDRPEDRIDWYRARLREYEEALAEVSHINEPCAGECVAERRVIIAQIRAALDERRP